MRAPVFRWTTAGPSSGHKEGRSAGIGRLKHVLPFFTTAAKARTDHALAEHWSRMASVEEKWKSTEAANDAQMRAAAVQRFRELGAMVKIGGQILANEALRDARCDVSETTLNYEERRRERDQAVASGELDCSIKVPI